MTKLFLTVATGAVAVSMSTAGALLLRPAPASQVVSPDKLAPQPRLGPGDLPHVTMTVPMMPPPSEPLILSAHTGVVPQNAEVIGVAMNGGSRAYLVSAFRRSGIHVFNDVLEGTGLAITRTRGVSRVLARGDGLPVRLMAGDDGIVHFDGEKYQADDEDLPLLDCPFTVTTWQQWRSEHPDSDIYVGSVASTASEHNDELPIERTTSAEHQTSPVL